jgi:hypothetical protein
MLTFGHGDHMRDLDNILGIVAVGLMLVAIMAGISGMSKIKSSTQSSTTVQEPSTQLR